MPAPAIKICGIRTIDALEAAVAGRARHVGLNFFAPSPRFISPNESAILAAASQGRIERVGVFVDAIDATIAAAVEAGKLDAIQLHGSESPERAAQVRFRFGRPVWKVISVSAPSDVGRAAAYADAADFLLFDAKTPKGAALPGGLGLAFDWALLAAYKGPLPWGLAGGLNPTNVSAAIAQTGTALVDTSSGVESAPGIKDSALIAEFCEAARRA